MLLPCLFLHTIFTAYSVRTSSIMLQAIAPASDFYKNYWGGHFATCKYFKNVMLEVWLLLACEPSVTLFMKFLEQKFETLRKTSEIWQTEQKSWKCHQGVSERKGPFEIWNQGLILHGIPVVKPAKTKYEMWKYFNCMMFACWKFLTFSLSFKGMLPCKGLR